MNMDTKINFNVKALGFPRGKIYKMYIWVEGNCDNAGKYIDDRVDEIKEQIKDVCHVHSIELSYTTYTNYKHEDEKYGDIVLDKEIEISTKDEKKKKVETKPVTDIKKIDLPNIDKDDLNTLKEKIDIELFKREHKLSDDVYNFYYVNMDLVSVDEAKEICKEHGAKDLFFLRKREVRKKVEGLLTT